MGEATSLGGVPEAPRVAPVLSYGLAGLHLVVAGTYANVLATQVRTGRAHWGVAGALWHYRRVRLALVVSPHHVPP